MGERTSVLEMTWILKISAIDRLRIKEGQGVEVCFVRIVVEYCQAAVFLHLTCILFTCKALLPMHGWRQEEAPTSSPGGRVVK